VDDFLERMLGLPPWLTYVLLGLGAALENVVPAVPADTFVALGGLLSAVGMLDARVVFLSTWLCNVSSALVMYRLGYKHGRRFFEDGIGRRLLAPHQLARMETFYARWGLWAIFFTRFLPGLRAIVPVFAGVTQTGVVPVAIPLVAASAIWYGGLVWLGLLFGRNLPLLGTLLGRMNNALGAVAVVLVAILGWWWWRTRHPPHD